MFDALLETMDRRLADRAYLAGDYSIADMAAFPWIAYLEPERGIAPLPHVQRWRDEIAARPAVRAAYGKAGSVDAGYARADNGATLFPWRSEEHTSALQSLMRTSYAVFCLHKNI